MRQGRLVRKDDVLLVLDAELQEIPAGMEVQDFRVLAFRVWD